MSNYRDFTDRLKLLIGKRQDLVVMTLGNIFTMRLVGNQTHGDLAEIAIAEFINQYMYDFKSVHVGKDLFRAKTHEEDIKIINEITKTEFPVSLKAYGIGPLQLSTDRDSQMFSLLEDSLTSGETEIRTRNEIKKIFDAPAFSNFSKMNVLPLIYDEKKKICNILVFDYDKAKKNTAKIVKEDSGRGRKHPVYRFYDKDSRYICEVRYGDAAANALQRGFWSHTLNGIDYFDSVTNGWIDYSINETLVHLFSHALVASEISHKEALEVVKKDIARLRARK